MIRSLSLKTSLSWSQLWSSWRLTAPSPGARRTGRSSGAASETFSGLWRRDIRLQRGSSSVRRFSISTAGIRSFSMTGFASCWGLEWISTWALTIWSERYSSYRRLCQLLTRPCHPKCLKLKETPPISFLSNWEHSREIRIEASGQSIQQPTRFFATWYFIFLHNSSQ